MGRWEGKQEWGLTGNYARSILLLGSMDLPRLSHLKRCPKSEQPLWGCYSPTMGKEQASPSLQQCCNSPDVCAWYTTQVCKPSSCSASLDCAVKELCSRFSLRHMDTVYARKNQPTIHLLFSDSQWCCQPLHNEHCSHLKLQELQVLIVEIASNGCSECLMHQRFPRVLKTTIAAYSKQHPLSPL